MCLFFAISSLVSWFFAIGEFDYPDYDDHIAQLVYTFWNAFSIICIYLCSQDEPLSRWCYVVCGIIYLIQLIGDVVLGIKYDFEESLALIWFITTCAACLICVGLYFNWPMFVF